MATVASPPPRRVFGELSGARLSTLSAKKNTQNAVTDLLAASKDGSKPAFTFASPPKRPFAAALLHDDHSDAENVDPTLLASSKRSKAADGTPTKKHLPALGLTVKPYSDVLAAPAGARRPTTPSLFTGIPAGASSAPAGRSPKHKRVGILSRKRTSLSPFKRVEPPAFGGARQSSALLPFSLDAALSGTLSSSRPAADAPAEPVVAQAPMPKGWFFEIHEDTPDEEATTIMEHSTCILDISSDDEAGPSSLRHDKGKENVPPADHQETQSRGEGAVPSQSLKPRRSVAVDAMTDAERAPLGEMKAEDFFGSGLDAASVQVVREEEAEERATACKPEPEPVAAAEAAAAPVAAVEAEDSFSQSAASFSIAEDADCAKA